MRVRVTSALGWLAIGGLFASASFAALLGIVLTGLFPQVNYVSTGSSSTSYFANSQNFNVVSSPVAIRLSPVSPPRLINPTGVPATEVLTISIQVDNAGDLVSGVAGDDLLVYGQVDIDGNGSIDYAGTLLTGEILAFGHQDTGTASDEFDFRFQVTGGSLAPVYFPGKDIGVTLTSEQSNFVGSFAQDFNGQSKGLLAPIDRINQPPFCSANGPYDAECAGGTTTIELDGSQSGDDDGDDLIFSWSTDCPNAVITDPTAEHPSLVVTTQGSCNVSCTVTLSVSDGVAPPTECTATVTITDTNAPSLSIPGDIGIDCDESSDPAQTGAATADDDCDFAPAVTYVDNEIAGSCAGQRVIERTWRAEDGCGNAVTNTQVITVSDSAPPTFLYCPVDIAMSCSDGTSPDLTGRPTVADNCDLEPDVTFYDTPSNVTCPSLAMITRTWVATDACGNSDSCEQTIVVLDATSPEVTCPDDRTLACGQSTAPTHTGQATAQDTCDPDPAVSFTDYPSGGCPQVIERVWTATDSCGEADECTQLITIVDEEPPSLSCPADITLTCGQSTAPASTGSATTNDACDPNPTLTYTDDGTGCPTVIHRTWKSTDGCGNEITCTQRITLTSAGWCPRTPGYWKNHLSAWPVTSLQVGCVTYNQAQLLNLLSNKLPNGTQAANDASTNLAKFVIAATFNLLKGSDPQNTQATLQQSHAFLCTYPPGSNTKGAVKNQGLALKDVLDAFCNSNPNGCVE